MIDKNPSKLKMGLVPAHTECPFKTDGTCPMVRTCCHKGVDHPCDFSCGAARFWDMGHRMGLNPPNQKTGT